MHSRVWTDVFDTLEEVAKTRRVSLNALVNQVLSSFTRDDLLLEAEGYVKMPKDEYRALLKLIPDDKLEEFGRESVKCVPMTEIQARSGAITLDSILEEMRFISRCGWSSLRETKRNGKTQISVIHDFGPRYSVIVRVGVMNSFALVGVRPKIATTNSLVTIEY
jgi:hypothetical protein